jgi:hypothetical protein
MGEDQGLKLRARAAPFAIRVRGNLFDLGGVLAGHDSLLISMSTEQLDTCFEKFDTDMRECAAIKEYLLRRVAEVLDSRH